MKFRVNLLCCAAAIMLPLAPGCSSSQALQKVVVADAAVNLLAPGQVRSADNGDGTFQTPPLYADFPDPDIIRVGDDFYFATTTFANSPALTILHSRDLVTWEYLSHVMPRLEGSDKFDLKDGGAYRGGVFAPSLRYYKGTFYAVVTMVGQNTRIYRATDPKGPWTMSELDRPAFDPGFFIDTDGKGYIATSGGWDGHVTLLTLNDDYTKVVDSKEIHFNKGAEGSKLIKRGDYYYLFNAIPGRLGLTVSRARSLFGPWETRNQIDDTSGGHQGALVDLPDGSWYGFVMRDSGAIGRMTNVSPVFWEDDWPVWGTKEAPGRVPAQTPKPIQGAPALKLATSDDFSGRTLGLQWQWNHNPDDSRWSLTERPGYLRLKPTQSAEFWTARNTLTQKGQGPRSRGEVALDISHIHPGDSCGLGTIGKFNGLLAVNGAPDGSTFLSMKVVEDTTSGQKTEVRLAAQPIKAKTIHMRVDMDFVSGLGTAAYSLDGASWNSVGGSFKLSYDWQTGTFQGEQFAIFCFNPQPGDGYLDIDDFQFTGSK